VTASHHGETAALEAQANAGRLTTGAVGPGGEAGTEGIPEACLDGVEFPAKAFYLLSAVGLCSSSSEGRRQIQGGGVKLDGEKLTNANHEFLSAAELQGKVLQMGKKTFRRFVGG